jgi:hypothetical protein
MVNTEQSAPELAGWAFVGKFLRAFFLMPYGGRLLTPSAATWMVPMFIVSIAMGAIEAVSWFEILTIFAKSKWPVWINLLLAGTIGVIIWQMDVVFVTLDLSHIKRQNGKASDSKTGLFSQALTVLTSKLTATVLTRLIFVLLSLVVTTPFIGELLQQDELRAKIDAHNRTQLATLRERLQTAIDTKYKDDLDTTQNSIDSDRILLRKELAGVGESRRAGEGPTATQLRSSITKNEARLKSLDDDYEREIREYKKLISENETSPEGLARISARYKIDLLTNSPSDLERARKQYITEAGYKIAGLPAEKVIASSLVTLLFVAMVLIKLMEPKAVSIYYDARLQSAFDDYTKGYFDNEPCLDKRRRSDGGTPMEAFSFRDWFYDVFEKFRLSEDDLKKQHEDKVAIERERRELDATKETVEKTLARKTVEYEKLRADLSKLDEQLGRDSTSLTNLRHRRTTLTSRVANTKAAARGDLIETVESELRRADTDLKTLRSLQGELLAKKERVRTRAADATRTYSNYLASIGRTLETNIHIPGENALMDGLYSAQNDAINEQISVAGEVKRTEESIASLSLLRERLSIELADFKGSSSDGLFSRDLPRGKAIDGYLERLEELQTQSMQIDGEEAAILARTQHAKQSRLEIEERIAKAEPSLDQLRQQIEEIDATIISLARRSGGG